MRSTLTQLFFPLACAALAGAASADVFLTSRGTAAILVFADDADGNATPIRSIQGPLTQIPAGNLNGIAVDAVHGEVFVSLGTGRILVFDWMADGNTAPIRTIQGSSTTLAFTAGLAVDPWNDELYAVNATAGAIAVFPRDASGNASPIRLIDGSATGIAQPTGIFVDLDADEIYLTNEANGSEGFGVFPRLGTGNIAPLRRVQGSATTFTFSVGVFRNPLTDETYVCDLFSARILVFAPGADGNVAPVRTISSSAFSRPGGLTFTNSGEILVVDVFGDGIVGLDLDASGASAATREIGGSATGIDTGIYVASTDSRFPGAVFPPTPEAGVSTRNAGINTMSLTAASAPVLGGDLEISVDLALDGDSMAFLLLTSGPLLGALPDGSVLLVGGIPLVSLGPVMGPVASFDLAVPLDFGLPGFEFSCQAVQLPGGPIGFRLSNALDFVVGV